MLLVLFCIGHGFMGLMSLAKLFILSAIIINLYETNTQKYEKSNKIYFSYLLYYDMQWHQYCLNFSCTHDKQIQMNAKLHKITKALVYQIRHIVMLWVGSSWVVTYNATNYKPKYKATAHTYK